MPHPVIVIPARLASKRLPGKVLAAIAGRPMIAHVIARALQAGIGPVIVATDDCAIATAVQRAGARPVMTRPDHASGSDRIAEAVAHVDPRREYDVVVNLQGDEPEIDPMALRSVVEPLHEDAVDIATLGTPLLESETADPNAVKLAGRICAPGRVHVARFTRAPIDGAAWRHIGVYAFRRAALERFVSLPPSESETRERLEQLRALDAGMRIDAMLVSQAPRGIDTPADLAAARARLAGVVR